MTTETCTVNDSLSHYLYYFGVDDQSYFSVLVCGAFRLNTDVHGLGGIRNKDNHG